MRTAGVVLGTAVPPAVVWPASRAGRGGRAARAARWRGAGGTAPLRRRASTSRTLERPPGEAGRSADVGLLELRGSPGLVEGEDDAQPRLGLRAELGGPGQQVVHGRRARVLAAHDVVADEPSEQ